MNHLVAQLINNMRADLEQAGDEQEEAILEAIQKLRDNREPDDEKPLVFSCSMTGKLNLDKSKVETAFSFSVKTTVKDSHTIKDPNQLEFSAN